MVQDILKMLDDRIDGYTSKLEQPIHDSIESLIRQRLIEAKSVRRAVSNMLRRQTPGRHAEKMRAEHERQQ